MSQSMSEDKGGGASVICLVVITAFVGWLIGYAMGASHTLTREREEAVRLGAGKWVLDQTTGETRFSYGRE